MNDYSPIADLYDLCVTDIRDHAFWRAAARDVSGRILELTAGTGRASVALNEGASGIVCFDLSHAMLRRLVARFSNLAQKPSAVCGDMCTLPFRAQVFELVVVPF